MVFLSYLLVFANCPNHSWQNLHKIHFISDISTELYNMAKYTVHVLTTQLLPRNVINKTCSKRFNLLFLFRTFNPNSLFQNALHNNVNTKNRNSTTVHNAHFKTVVSQNSVLNVQANRTKVAIKVNCSVFLSYCLGDGDTMNL